MNVTETGQSAMNDTDPINVTSIGGNNRALSELLYCGQGLDDFHTR